MAKAPVAKFRIGFVEAAVWNNDKFHTVAGVRQVYCEVDWHRGWLAALGTRAGLRSHPGSGRGEPCWLSDCQQGSGNDCSGQPDSVGYFHNRFDNFFEARECRSKHGRRRHRSLAAWRLRYSRSRASPSSAMRQKTWTTQPATCRGQCTFRSRS